MQRARQIHQKLERRQAILAMAFSTLEDTPFQDITMTQIATRAGLVKGTLYLYFATKEELFLEVLRDELHGWCWDLEAGLEVLPRRARLEATTRLLVATTTARPCFRRLLGQLHGILEHNLPAATALAFRREWLARSAAMGGLLERALDFLDEGQGLPLLLQVYALTIGLQAMAEPAAMTRKLLELPDLAPFRLAFPQAFQQGVHALLTEFKHRNRLGSRGLGTA
jgi:TetR/AcrR family transcriptional regulator